jgi:hypothetical protein
MNNSQKKQSKRKLKSYKKIKGGALIPNEVAEIYEINIIASILLKFSVELKKWCTNFLTSRRYSKSDLTLDKFMEIYFINYTATYESIIIKYQDYDNIKYIEDIDSVFFADLIYNKCNTLFDSYVGFSVYKNFMNKFYIQDIFEKVFKETPFKDYIISCNNISLTQELIEFYALYCISYINNFIIESIYDIVKVYTRSFIINNDTNDNQINIYISFYNSIKRIFNKRIELIKEKREYFDDLTSKETNIDTIVYNIQHRVYNNPIDIITRLNTTEAIKLRITAIINNLQTLINTLEYEFKTTGLEVFISMYSQNSEPSETQETSDKIQEQENIKQDFDSSNAMIYAFYILSFIYLKYCAELRLFALNILRTKPIAIYNKSIELFINKYYFKFKVAYSTIVSKYIKSYKSCILYNQINESTEDYLVSQIMRQYDTMFQFREFTILKNYITNEYIKENLKEISQIHDVYIIVSCDIQNELMQELYKLYALYFMAKSNMDIHRDIGKIITEVKYPYNITSNFPDIYFTRCNDFYNYALYELLLSKSLTLDKKYYFTTGQDITHNFNIIKDTITKILEGKISKKSSSLSQKKILKLICTESNIKILFDNFLEKNNFDSLVKLATFLNEENIKTFISRNSGMLKFINLTTGSNNPDGISV